MKSDTGDDSFDDSLLVRVSEMSPGSQRWLKTALQAIVTTEPDEDQEPAPLQQQLDVPQTETPDSVQAPASLEDVINGQADLRDHLKSYPELAEELEGLADVIDLLREAGQWRSALIPLTALAERVRTGPAEMALTRTLLGPISAAR